MRFSRLTAVVAMLIVTSAEAQETKFSWNHVTVYQLVTDRFSNGDSSNDFAYGRGLDGSGSPYAIDSTGHFLGGDFAGLTGWIEDGYFTDLGINVLWISAPYEQIHGWVGGGDGDFQEYAYHGFWPLDFTEVDRAFGTEDDFRQLVDAAHNDGLRLIVDVNLNHVGPATMYDMSSFNFGGLNSEAWRSWKPVSKLGWQSYQSEYVTFADSTEAWSRWWGPDWIRANITGYEPCRDSGTTQCEGALPDIRSDVEVGGLPDFLKLKWGVDKVASEEASLDAFFTRTSLSRTAAHHVVKWLSDWVRVYGIDGFRIANSENVEPAVMVALRIEATIALQEWKELNPEKALDDKKFWMAGEARSMASESSSRLQSEFDSVLNRDFRQDDGEDLHSLYSGYVSAREHASVNQLSFLSSHDTSLFDRSELITAGTRLLLSPGGVSVFYGDESARREGRAVSDSAQQTRSLMNWASTDEAVLAHWQKVGLFRAAHPAIARGGHDIVQEEPYTFYRGLQMGLDTDEVVIVVGASGKTRINVSLVWPDDTVLRDAYTGSVAFVSFGQVTFTADPSGLILMEEVRID